MNQFRKIVEDASLVDVSESVFALAGERRDTSGLYGTAEYYRQYADLLIELSQEADKFRRDEIAILLQKADLLAVLRFIADKNVRTARTHLPATTWSPQQ